MHKRCIKKILLLAGSILFAFIQNTVAQINTSAATSLNKISTINKNWQQGGIFNGEYPEKEILTSRTEYTKKFDKGNGVIDMIFGGPFHYADNKGGWQDINLNIKHQASGAYPYLNEENKFISHFAQNANDGVKMEYKNNGIGFGINTSLGATNWTPIASNNFNILTNENSITYKNIYENIDLTYELTTEAIQHRMIFKNKNVFNGLLQQQFITVEETINLPLNSVLKDDIGVINTNRITKGNIFIIVNADTIFTILSAHIWDASFKGNILEKADEIINGVSDIKTSAYFLHGNAIKFIASIPTAWLFSPERIYPITFDPTVNIGNAGSFNSSYRYPFNTCRQQRISQILFLKNDINAGGINTTGNITQIDFFQNTNNPIANNNVRVKMQEVTWNVMTTPTLTSTGFLDCNVPATQNFTSGGSNNWRSLTLGNQFPFTNTKNLLIEVSFNNSPNNTSGCTCTNTGPGGYWGWYNSPYAGHRWAYSNSAAMPPSGADCNYSNSPEGNPAYGYFIPATRITINTAAGCSPVSISNHPSSQTLVAPAPAQFSVSVSGTTPSYQWKMSTDGGVTWSNTPALAPYAGSTSNQLTINPTSAGMNGNRFRCEVTNSCTTPSPATSNTAVLTINAVGCTTFITPTSSPSIPAVGGTGSFSINVSPNTCSWSASETLTWVTITSPLSGTGDATLNYTVAANTGTARNGIITVNGQNYTVYQLGAAAPTTYIISGRVIENGSPGLPGVTISTSPAAVNAVTDAQGYYTITVPLSYTGTVTPTLAPFNFTPASRPVSSTNYNNKDFDAAGVSIAITSSVIPPWQREGDDYNGSINVQIGNTTTNSWHLEADVYNGTTWVGNVTFPSTTSNSYQFNTSLSTPVQNQQLKNLSLNGRTIKYAAVFDANTTIQAYPGVSTNIIEKKWIKKDVIYYNTYNSSNPDFDKITIPVPYLFSQPQQIDKVEIIRIKQTWSGMFAESSEEDLKNTSNSNIFSVANGYCTLLASTSNIENVFAGEFQFKIYAGNNLVESGLFNLTKTGRISQSPYNNKVVIFVGGIWNDLEGSFKKIESNYNTTSTSSSDFGFSLATYLAKNNFNVWYIAQSNGNYTQRNAYAIKLALERIYSEINPIPFIEFNIVVHSKGGLDTRAMLSNMACSYEKHNNTNAPPTFLECSQTAQYSNSIILPNGILKKVIFLATPHNGANWLSHIPSGVPFWQLGNQPALKELQKATSYPIINNLNDYGRIPASIKLANITAYSSQGTFTIFPLWATYYNNQFRDGPVNGESSDCISNSSSIPASQQKPIRDVLNNIVPVIQMYQDHPGELGLIAQAINPNMPHLKIHTNKTLSKVTSLIHSTMNCTETTYNPNTLIKTYNFLNNASGPYTVFSCGRPSMSSFYVLSSGSVLSGATLYRKLLNDTFYSPIGITKDNGEFIGTIIPALQIGDSIKIEVTGYETLKLSVDPILLVREKLIVSMIKTSTPTSKIKYPSFKMTNQNPITSNSSISFEITGQNVLSYQINNPLDQDSVFVPINLNNNTFTTQLANGYNHILIKYIGQQDTVILAKDVYSLQDTSMTIYGMDCSVNVPNAFKNSKMFVNNLFYNEIFGPTSFKLLRGANKIKFSKYGYQDTIFNIDTVTAINLSMQPYSYSSTIDSTVFNFLNRPNPQYWKTITVKSLSSTSNKQLSVMQYDDAYVGMSLKPQTRKFVFRKLGSAAPASFKTAIALDQINTPDKDSVYLLYKNGNDWIKYQANQSAVSEYDPEVQKIAFDKLYIDDIQTRELVLMQKQAPIMKTLDTIWHSGQTIAFPISIFVGDPDSIKNDLGILSNDVKVSVIGNIVYITAPVNFTGTTTYSLSGTHDFLTVSKTYIMKVIPPEVFIPNAFTPNLDGLNDVIRPIFLGKLISCHFTIFNRNGQKIYETTDCTGGWNGRIKGAVQDPGTYVWMLSYQFEGEEKKEAKGTVILIR